MVRTAGTLATLADLLYRLHNFLPAGQPREKLLLPAGPKGVPESNLSIKKQRRATNPPPRQSKYVKSFTPFCQDFHR
jgi:hypothetical protein